MPRVFVEYTNLLEDWRREVKRISAALDIDLDHRDEDAIEDFLTADLRHHRNVGEIAEPFGTDWMRTTYDAMSAAARDESCDEAVLDRVFEAYRVSERGFRTAFEGAHRYRKIEPASLAAHGEVDPRGPRDGQPAQGDVGLARGRAAVHRELVTSIEQGTNCRLRDSGSMV